MDILTFLTWDLALLALITTFLTSALTTVFLKYFPKEIPFRRKLLTLAISIVVTIFGVKVSFADWQNSGLNFMLTLSFSVLFYQYLGGWVISYVFEQIKKKLTQ